MNEAINKYLQAELLRRGCEEFTACEAAKLLDDAGLLKDSRNRQGLPLRRLLRLGRIAGSVQIPPQRNGSWFIRREVKSNSMELVPKATSQPQSNERDITSMQSLSGPRSLDTDIAWLKEACMYWTGCLMTARHVLVSSLTPFDIPKSPGVYAIRHEGKLVYVGKASSLRRRILGNHLKPRLRSSTLRRKVSKHLRTIDEDALTLWLNNATIAWVDLKFHPLALAVEDYAISELNPPFNGYT